MNVFTCDGLGVERDDDSELLSESVHNVTGNPHVVSDINTKAGTNLVFPLSRHHFSVDTSDLNASIEASAVVSLNQGSSESFVSTSTAVVGTLGSGETTLGPSERGVIKCE